MALKNLQTRVDNLFDITFGQLVTSKKTGKTKSRATGKMRTTLGAMDLECDVNAHVIAKTLADQFIAQQVDLAALEEDAGNGTLLGFGMDIVDGFATSKRLSGTKPGQPYKWGTRETFITGTPTENRIEFTIRGIKRNDVSFAKWNAKISQKLMVMDKYKAYFSGKKVREVMEMAHGKEHGIVEHKAKLVKRELSDDYLTQAKTDDEGNVKLEGIDITQIPTGVRDKLKELNDFRSDLALDAEHSIQLNAQGKIVGTTIIKAGIESRWQNQEDSRSQQALGQDIKDTLKDFQKTIKEAFKDPNLTVEQKASRPIVDLVGDLIVMSPLKRKMYAKRTAINRSKYNVIPKSKPAIKASKKGQVTRKRQKIQAVGVTKENTAPQFDQEKGAGEGKENYAMQMRNLLKVKNAINKRLPAEIRRSMGRPHLVNRSGRFSNSVRVESILPAAQTLMVKYNYRLNPYETFENKGSRRWPVGYNPKPLISKSIRQLALGLIDQKLTIRRA